MRQQTFDFTFNAPPDAVYRAMLDAKLLPQWRVPDDMTMVVHAFEAKEGGRFRISLSYRDTDVKGKTVEHTDTYRGYFKRLVPGREIVEVLSFEAEDAALTGEMTITTRLSADGNGTKMIATHENLPAAVPADQNELGWKMSLRKLADLLEHES